MITLRRSEERFHDHHDSQEAWLTFYPQGHADPLADGFGVLEILNENQIPPGAGLPHGQHPDAEIVTYIREGALACEDSMGHSGVILAGEFQRMTTGRRIRHSETNASSTDRAHVFQIWLRPSRAELEPGYEQKRFSTGDRRGRLCVVASPDGRLGSLRIHQDARIYSSLLEPGQHIVHEMALGRRAWLHVVQGEVGLGDLVLTAGDGAGITAERAVSFTARGESEILLVDFFDHAAVPCPN